MVEYVVGIEKMEDAASDDVDDCRYDDCKDVVG